MKSFVRHIPSGLFSGVFGRIFLSTICLCAAIILVFASLTYLLLEGSLTKSIEYNLEGNAAIFRDAITAGVPIEQLAKTAKMQSGIRTTLIDRNGNVVFDSAADSDKMTNHLGRVEVRRAFNGQTAFSKRFSETLGSKMIYIAMPAATNASGLPQYCVRQSAKFSDLDKSKFLLGVEIISVGFASAVLAGAVSWLLAVRISRPIVKLTDAAANFAKGNLDISVPKTGTGEIKMLGDSLSIMAAELRKRIIALGKRNCELDEILSNMAEAVFICSSDGEIRRFNQACSELFPPSEDSGRHTAAEVFRNSAIIECVNDVFSKRETVHREIEFGDDRIYELRGVPLKYESKKGRALFVLRDISREKNAERLRREFVAGASHELKTPITAIKMTAETLAESSSDPQEKHFISIIENQTDRMAALIEDMLLLSRIEFTGKNASANFVKFPIAAAVSEAVSAHKNQILLNGDSLLVECPDSIEITGDFTLVQIAISNLIGNAVKYGGKNCSIKISTVEENEFVSVKVSDTGAGISREDLPRIFERFYRADKGRSRALGGTGLGLALVKHIAILHGGSASVESVLAKGSTFTLTFAKN